MDMMGVDLTFRYLFELNCFSDRNSPALNVVIHHSATFSFDRAYVSCPAETHNQEHAITDRLSSTLKAASQPTPSLRHIALRDILNLRTTVC